ncbi:MAG TPA: lysylphosphatidylglycerol synthase transmembrane domain-containing protein [Azospirillaceae bacterium]|nr:lysylphosphatidylglycerol synthase transmembrane domain-containing protein [Azospirillaceae bacterium]
MNGFTRFDLRRIEYLVALSVALFAAMLAVTAALVGGQEVLAHLTSLKIRLVGVLLALSLVNYAARAVRWHLCARYLGLRPPFWQSILYYFAGFALTTTPGKVGEALRLWLMERCNGYPYARTIPLLLADRVVDLVAMAMLSVIGLFAVSSPAWLYVAGIAGIVGLLLFIMRPKLVLETVALGYRLVGRWPRLFGRLRGAVRRTSELFTPKILAVTLGLTVVGWLAECLAFALVLHAFGVDIGLLGAILTFTVAMLAGALTFLPGGLGGTEATMVALLAIQGVGLEVAIPATAVIRFTTLWFAVALGFLALSPAMHLARRAVA